MFCCIAVRVLLSRQWRQWRSVAIRINEKLKPEIANNTSDKWIFLGQGHFGQVHPQPRQTSPSSSVPDQVLGGHITLNTIGDSPSTMVVAIAKGLESKDAMRHESQILQGLQHPNIIRLVAPFTSNVVVETASGLLRYDLFAVEAVQPLGHDLVTYCSNFRWRVGQLVPVDHVKCFVEKCAAALEYMHDRGVVHRDLKPDNVLIVGNLSSPKLADFGFASTPQHRGRDMRANYRAPEVNHEDHPTSIECLGFLHRALVPRCYHPSSIDIWGLGVCVYSMYDSYSGTTARWTALRWNGDEVTGGSPFKGDSTAKIGGSASLLEACDMWLQKPISPKVLDLIRHLLRQNPKERWSQQQIKQWIREDKA
jgi:serine/threonine protein kinase